MEIKQQLKLSQQLVMTPQLQQAIKLLQMSRMELVDLVRDEMLENPILEEQLDQEGRREAAVNGGAREASESRAAEASSEVSQSMERRTDDIDWDRYLENHALQAPMPTYRGAVDSEELPNVETTLTRSADLTEHLMWQMRFADLMDEEQRFATLVIGNLDEDGYLKMEDVSPEEVVPRLAGEAEIDPEDAEEVLKILQRLDPIGVACRSLTECLLVQAERFGMDRLVIDVIRDHLPDLEKRNYQNIAKLYDVPVDEIYDVAQVIAELEPRPGRNYTGQEPHYVTPDVYVHKVGDRYFVVPNDDGMPRLKISGFYRSAMAEDPKAREYIQTKLRSAQWLIRSIDQRRKTIVKVTECIVDKQHDFFESGIEHLRPMILRDVAETVGMHESTISRVTSNKYVHTPRGLFELKYFFNSAIHRDSKEDIASESVKQAIRKIIGEEDPRNPYSDQKILEILAQDGIVIARRTVAKYREMMGVLSSSRRKKYF